MLLRAGLSGLSLLRCERCRCVELLLHALFGAERLLGLARLRASAGGGRHRCFTESAPGKRQTRHDHEKHLFHLATPIRSDTGICTIRPAYGKCATLIFPRQFRQLSDQRCMYKLCGMDIAPRVPLVFDLGDRTAVKLDQSVLDRIKAVPTDKTTGEVGLKGHVIEIPRTQCPSCASARQSFETS